MIIFAGIVAGFPPALGATAQLVSEGSIGGFTVIAVLAPVALVTWGVLLFERAQRRTPIHPARRQQRRKIFAAQTQHLPLPLNMSALIPPHFPPPILLFPPSLLQLF